MKGAKIASILSSVCLTFSMGGTPCKAASVQPDLKKDKLVREYDDMEIDFDYFDDHVSVVWCDESGDVVIPSKVDGLPVTKIEDGALYAPRMTSLVLPDTIEEIGSHMCVGCEKLKSVKLPSKIKTIPEFAFEGCRLLEKIEIPSGVTEIGRSAFSNCTSLKKLKLPEKLEILGDGAFDNCSLETVDIPEGVREIPIWCFMDNNFKELVLPENVEKVGSWAFSDCSDLEKVTVLNPECEFATNFNLGLEERDENGYVINDKRDKCTYYGYKGSTLEKMAKDEKIKFVALDEENNESLGDTNGDGKVDSVDASYILKAYSEFSTGTAQPTEEQLACCDITNDGKIDSVDASKVLSYYSAVSTGSTISFTDFLKNG
jgi:hypothetical protein